ncbi:type IV secretion protein Rhs [Arthrobacter sp. AQ5-05]|uniref:DUF6531 domain-containing protein n=1 Tax=Arthrobacter sp. AQ5-05 TaxID=2184581 RepID=UPI000DCBCD92|nr:DUF6531 domain-containing protein [Arthrobacter sp. AQ5-05]RAX49118.1 type IV secretion protein Rhs [Arthrobacter sp. AQ5-05]
MADLGVFDHDVVFDNGTADALISAFNLAALSIEEQSGSRSSLVATAGTEFKGHFSQLFADNARVASADATELAARLREAATGAKSLKEEASKENERRRMAREWKQRRDERRDNFLAKGWDWVFGEEEPPVGPPAQEVSIEASAPVTGIRQTPAPGGGSNTGISAARPSDLRSFATGSANLNTELAGRPAALRGHLADFASRCSYGSLHANGVVSGFDKWLDANDQDVAWALAIANAFAAAGGEGNVSRLADSALMAALAAQGVGATRQDIAIDAAFALGAQPTTGYSMDPVNTSTGNFLETEVDLGFAGAAAALVATRTYNSLDERSGAFGLGWASVLDTRLELEDEGAWMVLADGRHLWFPRLGGGWDRAEGESSWLEKEIPSDEVRAKYATESAEVLVVRDNAGARWMFTMAGAWLSSDTGPGTAVLARRDAEGRIAELAHQRGRWVRTEFTGERITALATSDGRRVEFEYDEHGQLLSAAGPGGVRRYRWNDAGLIEAVTDAAGVEEAVNTYDEHGRVKAQVSAFGRVTRFAYLPGRLTVVSDADGTRSNAWIADAKGRLVGVIDAEDNRQSMSYDRHGNLVSTTERDGSLTVHAYDRRGRKIRTLTPSGADITYGYDEADRPVAVVTESGATVHYEYADDSSRNPSLIIDPEGGRTQLHWREGLLEKVTDPVGVTLAFGHDAHGDLSTITNAFGNTATLHRDAAGQVTEAVSPGGARTTYLYDASGRLSSRRDADGALWKFGYAPGGALAVVTDPLGARTEMHYGPHGKLAKTIDPLGRAVTRSFDDFGLVTGVELPDGSRWGFAHDALSRLTQVTDPAGQPWSREYNKNGELAVVVDPTGVRQQISADVASGTVTVQDAFERSSVRCDEFGRPVATERADGSTELVTYDACGRPVELVDAEGGLTLLRRDAAGRVIEHRSPGGAVTSFEYDAAGRPAASVDPTGVRTTLEYDADSRVVARVFPGGETERLEYDAVGRVASRYTPGRGTSRFEYDLAGRMVRAVDSSFGRRKFRYDAAGQLVEAVNGLGGKTRYEYDARGRLTAVTDPLGATTRRSYNEADQVVAEIDPLGRSTTAGFDPAGRQLWQCDPEGRRTEWRYDAAGRQISLGVDGQQLMQVSRDARSRTVRITDHTREGGAAVEQLLRFNRRGQLIQRLRNGDGPSWEYDADGNRTAMVDPQGTRTEFGHDAAGRVVVVEHPVFGRIAYERDAAGRMVGAVASDAVQNWDYAEGAVVRHTTTTVDGVTETFIRRDADGRIAAILADGTETRFFYDAACQLERSVRGDGVVSEWRYDLSGRLVVESVEGLGAELAYDAAGQLRSRTDNAGATTYAYDGLGRRTEAVGPDGSVRSFEWSPAGWLDAVATADSAGDTSRSELWVDALGELAEVDGTEVWWDSAEVAPRLMTVGDQAVVALPGGVTAVGDTMLSAGWRSAHPTQTGSPWGTAADALPGIPPGLAVGASGGLQVAGLDWFGARAYDPLTHGFLSVDPLDPVVGSGWAGNPYSFAGNDPLHAIDPLGLQAVTEAELQAYRDGNNGALAAAGDWWADNWEYVAGGAMVVAGGVLMATGVGGPAGMMLIGAGADVIIQKATTGDVNWGQTAVMGLAGGLGGLAMAGRLGATGVTGIKAAVGEGIASGAASGGTGNAYTYATGPGPHTATGFLGASAMGLVSGGAMGGAGAGVGHKITGRLLAPLTTRPKADTIVMGRWMGGRVIPYADSHDYGYYNATPQRIHNFFKDRTSEAFTEKVDLAFNKVWINGQIRQGKTIVDIGESGPAPSVYYNMELESVSGYPKYVQDTQRPVNLANLLGGKIQ